MPWVFLIVSVWGALFTLNAYWPSRRLYPLVVPSFFAGWLTSELPVHHVVWQALATVGFVALGALDKWPGVVGLGLTLLSWAGLFGLVRIASRAERVLEEALQQALGRDYRKGLPEEQVSRRRRVPWNPFAYRHPDVEVHRHIPYATEAGHRHQLDVYTPRQRVTRAPVLFQIHGGAWVVGNKREQALPLMNHLTSKGWICVAANYRLSPRTTFPDHLVDLKRALAWVKQHIDQYGGDPGFVVATGGSAGGHLASLLSLTANDPEYQPGFEQADTAVAGCVSFYGVYDFTDEFELRASRGIEGLLERMVMKKRLVDEPEAFRRASPMHRVHPDAPPFFVLHGTHDSLISAAEGRHFAKRLHDCSKAPVAYAELPGAQHAFELFHSVRCDLAVEAVDRFLSWVHARYRSEQAPETRRRSTPSRNSALADPPPKLT